MVAALSLVPPVGRKVEDKLEKLSLALREYNVHVDLSEVHGNRDMPGFFRLWLAINDSTLPLKGNGHRANRHASDASSMGLAKDDVNVFHVFT